MMANLISRRSLALLQKCRKNPGKCSQKLSTTSFIKQEKKEVENTNSKIDELQESARKSSLTSIDQFRADMKPFLKETFCGNFDTIVLSFPDVLANDRYFNLENVLLDIRNSLSERQDLINEIESKGRISKDLLMSLRSKRVFALRGSQQLNGEGFSVTESLRVIEEIANANLSLSNIVVNSSWYGAEVIRKYASDELKEKYLPLIHDGTCICSICVADNVAGFDANSSSTEFLVDSDGITMIGDKLWVTNAKNADVFLVWGKQASKLPTEGGLITQRLSGVLVDAKEAQGINVGEENYPTRGLKGCDISTVTFDKVHVPLKNQIIAPGEGFSALTNCLKDEAKLAGSVQVLAALRKILNTTIMHSISRRAFGAELSSYDLVKEKISKCSLNLYALESMIYMTAGLADYQKKPDYCLEAAACRIFASQTTNYFQESCKSILGSSTYLNDNTISNLFDDIEGLSWWESSHDMNLLYLGLGGLSYMAQNKYEDIRTLRRPAVDLVETYRARKRKIAKIKLKGLFNFELKLVMQLRNNVHPSLTSSADKLERVFLKFDKLVTELMIEYGTDIQLLEIDVARIARCSTNIYAMISTLARTNRSYCDGHANAALEVKMCNTFILLMENVVENELDEALATYLNKADPYLKSISEFIVEDGRYSAVHPMTKNIF